ncbi:MAG: Fic family protein [Verrucomicrobia bacterium]|nr:Fic family protein [Verrucomicrobiota bacterium]
MSEEKAVFRDVAAIEPLLPDLRRADLAELSQKITLAVGELRGFVHAPVVREKIAALVREMNCYYSNLIEGHKTLPRDIERAQHADFAKDQKQKENQLLAVAHIQTEEAMLTHLRKGGVDVYSPEFLCWIHSDFYRRLPESMHVSKTKAGKEYRIVPGQPRDYMVDVGPHTPPDFAALPAFLDRFREAYSSPEILATDRLVAIAAAHQRLAWIHPFGDGNGRVARLHSHALLQHHDLDGHGMWTLSRGLARARQAYYNRLHEADQPRRNDYDGRGSLSERGLSEFCRFFLETILDQVTFMGGLLKLPDLRTRVERHFTYESLHLKKYREELMRIVRALVDEGELTRERASEITGKGRTIAVEIIKLGLKEGYIESPSAKGKLRIAFPAKVLPSYFPNLFIDLPVEQEK